MSEAKKCADPKTLCVHKQYAPATDPVDGKPIPGLTDGGGQFLAGKAFPLAGDPEIIQVDTFREGEHVFFSLLYSDPSNEVAGFGFRGAKGASWAEERHTFGDQSYARVSPETIEYPFNHLCESGPAYESDVEVWLQDSAGNQITPTIPIHLACSAPSFVILGPATQPRGME